MQFKPLKGISFVRTNGKIVNPIDLMQITEKAPNYRNFSEFRNDILWFIHNCNIYYDDGSDILNAANEIMRFVDEEIMSVTQCTECYSISSAHSTGSFVMTCSRLHPAIWARSENFYFWPAKAIGRNGELVYVRYFGDHCVDYIPVKNCYKFSLQPPKYNKSAKKIDGLDLALQVCR